MLSYTAIIPGSPIFIDGLGINTSQIAKQQRESIDEIINEIYSRNTESVILLMPGDEKQKNFEIHLNKDFSFDLSDFGELKYPDKILPDFQIIDRIQRILRKEGMLTMLETEDNLPFQGAPALTKLLKVHKPKIVPIIVPRIEHKKLFLAGKLLREVVLEARERIAVIAVGDAYSDEESSKHLADLVSSLNAGGLISRPASTEQDILEQILVLFGILDMHSVVLEHFSYQNPLGVGFITAGIEV